MLNLGSNAALVGILTETQLRWFDGRCVKEQGHIHRGMLIRDYYGFQLHEGGLQPSIRTMNGFRDYLHLSVSEPTVPSFVARVSPGRFGAYGPIVAPTFL